MQVKVDDFEGFFYGVIDRHKLVAERRVDGGELPVIAGHYRNPAPAGDEFAGSGNLFWLLLFENAAGTVNRLPVFVG